MGDSHGQRQAAIGVDVEATPPRPALAEPLLTRADLSCREILQALPFEFFPGGKSSDNSERRPPFLDFCFCGLDGSVADEEWKRALAPINGRAGNFVRLVAGFSLGYQGFPWEPTDPYKEASPANLSLRSYNGRLYLDWEEIKQKQEMLPEKTPFFFELNETKKCRYVTNLLKGSQGGEDSKRMLTLVDELVKKYRAGYLQVNVNGDDVDAKLFEDPSFVEASAKVLHDLCGKYPNTLFLVPITVNSKEHLQDFFERIVKCDPTPPNLCGVLTRSAGIGAEPTSVPRLFASYPTGTGRRIGFSGGINCGNAKEWLDRYTHRAREHRCRLVLGIQSGLRQGGKRGEPVDVQGLQELSDSLRAWAEKRAENAERNQNPEWKKWLGEWYSFIQPDARKLAEDLMMYDPHQKIRGRDFAESALNELRLVGYQWIVALGLPFGVSRWLCECPKDGLFASYSLFAWVLVVPVLAYVVYCERNVLKWTLASLAQYCAPFKLLQREVSCVKWVVISATMGFLGHLDIYTTGLFLAKILKTKMCPGDSSLIELMWATSINTSLVSWVPYLNRLMIMFLAGWVLIFLQPLHCAICTIPLHSLTKEQRMKKGYSTLWSRCAMRFNGKEFRVFPADALQSLGLLNRMYTVIGQNLGWTISRAEEELGTDKTGREIRALDMVNRELDRVVSRLWLKYLVQDVFIMEANVTVFAISSCLMPRDGGERIDWQMLLSLSISVIGFAKNLAGTYADMKRIHIFSMKDDWANVESRKGIQSKQTHLWTLKWLGILGLFVMLGWLAHSFAKLTMAFVCENSIWNIPFPGAKGMDSKGCVDMRWILAGRP
mmetsp:Transcript_84479/g.262299  ORF Transcript_84479/g.262299 Transcript_84479/m.262299 type:complete len:830 (+) Transcript_84479:94-2583(+)